MNYHITSLRLTLNLGPLLLYNKMTPVYLPNLNKSIKTSQVDKNQSF